VTAHFADYRVELSPEATQIRVGEYVEFIATSGDVTYGFGVFRQDGRMILQMQVMPGHENRIMWRFDEPGVYDVRSTEYSGPRHPETFLDDAIVVTG
jgi:cytochrome c oxidase subunit 2